MHAAHAIAKTDTGGIHGRLHLRSDPAQPGLARQDPARRPLRARGGLWPPVSRRAPDAVLAVPSAGDQAGAADVRLRLTRSATPRPARSPASTAAARSRRTTLRR